MSTAGRGASIRPVSSDDPMDPEGWHGVANVCGSCIAWKPDNPKPGEEVAAGSCKLRPELGRVPADLKKCERYMPRGQFVYQPQKDAPSRRRAKTLSVLKRGPGGTVQRTDKRIAPDRPPVPREIDLGDDASAPAIRQALAQMLASELGPRRPIHPKFEGGQVELKDQAGHTIVHPIERFFASLDRLASALSALERAMKNGDPELASAAKEHIGRIRGSLTTFNVTFKRKEDQFRS